MRAERLREKLRGVIIAIITPFKSNYALDLDGLKENIRAAVTDGIENGRGGFIVCGGGGELPFLTIEERGRVVKAAVGAADGRAPILAGVQDNGTQLSIELAKQAEDAGADGIQLGPPYFYHTHSEDDVFRYYEAISKAIHIGIAVYNTWWRTRNMTSQFITKLAELDNVVGVKWSSPDTTDYVRGLRFCADKLAMIDNQGLQILSHALGVRGFISGTGDFCPQHDLRIWDLLERREYDSVKVELARLNWPLYDFRRRIGERTGGEAPVKKAAAELVGRAGGPPRPPSRGLTEAERTELRDILRKGGVPLVT